MSVADDICDDRDDEYADRDTVNCQTCGGDGFEECEDTNSALGCWIEGCDGYFHTCPNCGGSGLAKDQWYW